MNMIGNAYFCSVYVPLISLLMYLPTKYGTQPQIPEIGISGSDSQYYLLNRTFK